MKKIILGIIVLIIAIAGYLIIDPGCKLEEEKVKPIAKSIVETLANYSRKNGIPESFEDIQNFPYKLTSCSEKPNLKECKNVRNKYFFIYKNEIYTIRLYWGAYSSGFGLMVQYHNTICGYELYQDKFNSNYLNPTCSLIPKCNGWGQ